MWPKDSVMLYKPVCFTVQGTTTSRSSPVQIMSFKTCITFCRLITYMSFWHFGSPVSLAFKQKSSCVLVISKHLDHLVLKSSSLIQSGKEFSCNLCYATSDGSFLKRCVHNGGYFSLYQTQVTPDLNRRLYSRVKHSFSNILFCYFFPSESISKITSGYLYSVLVSKRDGQKRIRDLM